MKKSSLSPDDRELPEIESYYSLKQLAELTGIPVKTIRRQVNLGHIAAIRPTDSTNSPIYVAKSEWCRFIDEVASLRQRIFQRREGVRHG